MIWVGLAIGGVLAVLIAYNNRKRDVPQLVCPHCGVRGQVSVEHVSRKQGISGGKATGALFTAGASMLLTGLSRKQMVRHCRCGNCNMAWDVA